MSTAVLILGETGTGKSTSVRTLNPDETFIINVVGKDLPFKGWKSKYRKYGKDTGGNMLELSDSEQIVKAINWLGTQEQFKNIIIDDFQYVMSYEFMTRAREGGYNKFIEIAQHAFNVIDAAKRLPTDRKVFFMSHIEQGTDTMDNKLIKIKTVGKLLDNMITVEGLFTIVFLTYVEKKETGMEYGFITQNDGKTTVKSPMEMFKPKIPNDLQMVVDLINKYEKGE
jgi:hypothetical protein